MMCSILMLPSLLAASIATGTPAQADRHDHEIVQLRSMVETLRGEVDELRARSDDDWLTQQRSEQIRGLVNDVLADSDTRASLQGDGATSGYDGGFFIRSADGKWYMKFGGQLQSRFMYNHAADRPADYGFETRRFKLNFSGHVMDPSWTYKLTFINQRDSQGTASAGFYAEDAWLQKTLEDGLYLRVGQFKAPMLREDLVSSSAQLAVERSVLNNQFTYSWTQGAEIGRQDESFWWRAMLNDGPNEGNQQSQGLADTVSVVARVDFRLAGSWKNWKSLTGRGVATDPYAFIGAAFQWFNNSNRGYYYGAAVPAAFNHTDYGGYDGLRSYGFTVDGSVGGDGWTAYAAFMWADNGASVNQLGDVVGGNTAWGVLAQIGVMLSEDVQVFGRWEHGQVGDYSAPAAQGGHGRTNILTVGVNVWLASGRTLKWSSDVGYGFSTINDGGNARAPAPGPNADWTSSGNGWRNDVNDQNGQWLVRTQLQLLF